MDGFYAAYITARAGQSIILWVIRGQTMIGVDVGGIKYDGELVRTSTGAYRCSVVYIVPAGGTVITGSPPAAAPQRIPVQFELPADFANGQIITIETPLGPVNARFEKLRDL